MTTTTPLRWRGIERAGSRRPITWLTIIGALLLPVIIGGILVTALYNPAERLEAVPAAIVNDDDPVTLDGQVVPLGRQLTAGLVEGSDDAPSNLDWTITNDEDAAAGLADGTYAAVVTIPQNFSAAATSTAPGSRPEQATISVTTPPDSLVVDDAISAQVTQAAASLTGTMLSTTYLENVFLGFTTLGDQLGTVAEGAGELATGARTAADGATQLADGTGQLQTGADALADGASELATGATRLSAGATQAAGGIDTLASGVQTTAEQSTQLANGLTAIAQQLPTDVPQVPQSLVDAAEGVSANSASINAGLTDAAAVLQQLVIDCRESGASIDVCDRIAAASQTVDANLGEVTGIVAQSGTIVSGLQQLGTSLPVLRVSLQELATGATQLSGGLDRLATGAATAADGVQQLSTGATALSTGARQLSSGATQLADGAETAATGATGLADGVGQLADGSAELSSGLAQAAEAVPSYSDAEAATLASVVADPVAAQGIGSNLFGATAIPLLATVALWFGGLGTFVALRAVTARAVTSRRPSAVLAAGALAPAAVIGAVQGLLVAGVVQIAASYDWADWSLFAVMSVVAGVAFSTVHQALVAVFGGAGRWIAALVGVLALATGIVSTVPGVLSSIAGILPTAPAYSGMVAALTTAGGLGAAVAGLIIWSLLAFAATTLAVTLRRSVPARDLLAAAPA